MKDNPSNLNSIKMSCLSKQDVELYLSGRLSADQERKIELHLSECELCSDAIEGLHSAQIPNLRLKTKSKSLLLSRIIGFSAAACLMLALGWLTQRLVNLPVQSQKESYQSDVLAMQKALEENGAGIDFALKLVQVGQYHGALVQLSQTKPYKPAQSLYYSAICQIKLGDYQAAKTSLEQLLHCCRFRVEESKSLLDKLNKQLRDNS
jgi:hypothetical protein